MELLLLLIMLLLIKEEFFLMINRVNVPRVSPLGILMTK